MKKMKGLKRVIECENNVENLKNYKKLAKKEGLEEFIVLIDNKIKKIIKEEKEKIKEEFNLEGEQEEKRSWKKNLHHCARCNKEIDFELKSKEIWGWKIGKSIFCSYSCYSKTFDERKKKGK